MSLARYAIKRALQLIPVFFLSTVVVFLLMHLAPGNPVDILFGTDLGPQAREAIKEFYRLDDPLWRQYLHWLGGLLRGNFGVIIGSGGLGSGQPVLPVLLSRLPVTLELTVLAIVMVVVVSIPAGLLAAFYYEEPIDRGILVLTLLGIGTPSFWLALFLILVFSVWVGLFPTGGWTPLSDGLVANLHSAFLPAVALAARYIGLTTRVFRADLLDVKEKPYIETARAMGAPARDIVVTDMFRNAAIPTLTIVGLAVIGMISGSILVEVVFGLPGLGQFMFNSILNQQYAAVQGITVFFVGLFVVVNLVIDVLYAVLDPRVVYE